MFKVNLEMVKEMTRYERFEAETAYLQFAYDAANERMISGSRAMRRSAETIALSGPTRLELNLTGSYKLLFKLSDGIFSRTGKPLVEKLKKEVMTADNAFTAWWLIYRKLDTLKELELNIFKEA